MSSENIRTTNTCRFRQKNREDNIAVGDTVVAHRCPPSSAYATSITRGTGKPTPPSPTPRLASKRSRYCPAAGRERLRNQSEFRQGRASPCGQRDQTRSTSERRRVVVITSTMPSDASMYSIYKLGNPNVFRRSGADDGDGYVIRESGGKDMRLRWTTRPDRRNITVGDKVVAITNSMLPSPVRDNHVQTRQSSCRQGEVVWTTRTVRRQDFTGTDVPSNQILPRSER